MSWRAQFPIRVVGAAIWAVALLVGCTESDGEPDAGPTTAGNPAEAIAACLKEKGWDVTAHPDNSVSAAIPSAQAGQYQTDYDSCRDEVQPEEPRPPMTEEQAEEYFDALLEVAECVRGLGYEVADPPSRQAAVEALQQEVVDLGWDPYEDVTLNAGSTEEIDEVYRECPQPPWPS